jgi:hypothetical protein
MTEGNQWLAFVYVLAGLLLVVAYLMLAVEDSVLSAVARLFQRPHGRWVAFVIYVTVILSLPVAIWFLAKELRSRFDPTIVPTDAVAAKEAAADVAGVTADSIPAAAIGSPIASPTVSNPEPTQDELRGARPAHSGGRPLRAASMVWRSNPLLLVSD